MIAAHTPGPWEVSVEIFDNDGIPETAIQALKGAATVAVAFEFGPNNPGMREANARRIVACVNACEGVSTEWLETWANPPDMFGKPPPLDAAMLMWMEKYTEASQRAADAAEQRDKLLAALKDEAFDAWFEQYRRESWVRSGCDRYRGPEPSANWSQGMRWELKRGWDAARAAIAKATGVPC
jgi:hypothetical protein